MVLPIMNIFEAPLLAGSFGRIFLSCVKFKLSSKEPPKGMLPPGRIVSAAWMRDHATIPDHFFAKFKANTITYKFEIGAICIKGDPIYKGKYLGAMTWEFSRTRSDVQKGLAGSFKKTGYTLQPSQDFKDAVNLWMQHFKFTIK